MNESQGQPSKSSRVSKTGGVFSRQLRKYTIKNPNGSFSWWNARTNFGQNEKVNHANDLSFESLCEMHHEDTKHLPKHAKTLMWRASMYAAVSVIYLSMAAWAVSDGKMTLIMMFATLPIITMLLSMGIRCAFWSYQIKEGLRNPERVLPSFKSWIFNPEHWF